MGKILVLAEKPSVGKELARVLGCRQQSNGYIDGPKYIVTWSLGHLVTLADPESYDKKYQKWDMELLPMLPARMKLEIIKETSKQFKVVSGLMKRSDIDSLVIATDAGREGELVARWIMEKSGWNKRTMRLWVSSQTDKAIKDGFASLKPASEYDNLYKSAKSRAEADWIVGLNVTRALTCKFGASLSAGRVQTPTLTMIVKREEEIKKFIPKEYYTVSIKCDGMNATYRDKQNNARIFDRSKADALSEKISKKAPFYGTLTAVTEDKKFKNPPAAYDLTELQRDANKLYAYSAKETLSLMQSLYEKHKVLTYPRTDSRYITKDVTATIPDRLKAVALGPYAVNAKKLFRTFNTRFIVNDAKVTDHHAIIPTEERPDFASMTGPEKNIYDLVVRRFLAVLMPPFEYEETKCTVSAEGENFFAKGQIINSKGWKEAYEKNVDDDYDSTDDDEAYQTLPPLKQGDRIKIISARVNAGKTKPPARYTDATLLSAMEHPASFVSDKAMGKILEETSGLGTPATRADIIEKLLSSFYVERRGKELCPTSKGIQLISIVPEELRSPLLTAQWEQRLALISKGKQNDRAFCEDMRKYAVRLVDTVKASSAVYTHDNQTKEKCPDCGKYLLDVNGKKGKMLVCPDRECGYRKSVSVITNARCPNCHKKMELRGTGDSKIFACVCGYREKEKDFASRRVESGAGKRDVMSFIKSQDDGKGFN
ncbi:MAG: DNA topoisomerase III, partial [Clostridia bacterium]|nr:DNA topoisomerase III [Clostridia bacterium]